MAAEFFLKVIASDKVFYSDYAVSLTVPAMDGQYQFLAHHSPAIVAVQPGEAWCGLPDGTKKAVIVGSGFVQAAHNRVTLLVDTAERPEDINEAKAREDIERAQEELRQKQSIHEYQISQATLARAFSRLKGKKDKTVNIH